MKTLLGVVCCATIVSCTNQNETNETTELEITEEVNTIEENTEEESAEVAFIGVTKGDYTLYGHTDFEVSTSIAMDAMLTEFEETGSFSGAVNIKINEVCQNAGCWINFQKPDTNESIMVFFRDHFTIPIEESLGKDAILYGTLISDTLTVDFQKHLLDDSAANGEKVTKEAYDAITEDKIDISFDCESILIKD